MRSTVPIALGAYSCRGRVSGASVSADRSGSGTSGVSGSGSLISGSGSGSRGGIGGFIGMFIRVSVVYSYLIIRFPPDVVAIRTA